MGRGERRHPRRPFARRLVGRSPDLRRPARRRPPVRGMLSRGDGGRLGSPRGGERARHRARQFRRTSPGDHVSRRAPLSSPLAPPGIASLCVSFPSRSAWPIRRRSPRLRRVTGLPLEASLQAFILAQIAAAVSAVVRLGPIGQTDGQKIQATLIPRIRALAREASGSSLTDLGSCAFRSDIAAMRHETQYSRLFRS